MLTADSKSAPAPNLPPLGDADKGEKYLQRLIRLINQDKVTLIHTDLNKFDLTTMQDHYRIDLKDYDVEVSHNIQAETDKDFYTLLFNSINKLQTGDSNKVVLAYIHLTEFQYKRFKVAADDYLERVRKAEDAKRFVQVMQPFDQVLENLDPGGENAPAEEAKPELLQIEPSPTLEDQPLASGNPSSNITNTPTSDSQPQLGEFQEADDGV